MPREALDADRPVAARRMRGARKLALVAVLLPGVALEGQDRGTGRDARVAGSAATSSRRLVLGLATAYHENPFGLKRHWGLGDSGEPLARLKGYASHWDIVTTGTLSSTHGWRRPDKSRLAIEAGVAYDRFAMNPDHSRASGTLALDYRSTGRAVTALQLEILPRTLDGNRRLESDEKFERAWFRGLRAELEHRRELNARIGIRGGAEYALRDFESPFRYRDRRALAMHARVDARFGAAVDLSGSAGIGRVSSPRRLSDPAKVRQYNHYDLGSGISISHGDWRFRARARTRHKSFDPYEGKNTMVERRDTEWRFDASATRRLNDRASTWVQSGYRSRVSERSLDDAVTDGPASSGHFIRLGTELTLNRR
jgi:hypothetical protein